MDLDSYRDTIIALAKKRDGTPVYNGSADHAAIIIEHLFLSAQEEVRLLSGDLNSRVYGATRVVQRAKEFLSHSHRSLKVLVERETFSATHPLIETMRNHDNVELALIPEGMGENLKYHLMTADRDCFRFEPEKDNHVAVAAFGDRASAENLASIFDNIWGMSQVRELPSAQPA